LLFGDWFLCLAAVCDCHCDQADENEFVFHNM
jgi:hypothetical protein